MSAAAALLACAAVAGCHDDSITQAEQPLTAVVWGQVYAPDGAPVTGATVRVEARRRSDMRLVSSTSAVTDAQGQFIASMRTRGVEQLSTIAFVSASPPAGMAVAAGSTNGALLFFVEGSGFAARVDVTLGTALVVPQD